MSLDQIKQEVVLEQVASISEVLVLQFEIDCLTLYRRTAPTAVSNRLSSTSAVSVAAILPTFSVGGSSALCSQTLPEGGMAPAANWRCRRRHATSWSAEEPQVPAAPGTLTIIPPLLLTAEPSSLTVFKPTDIRKIEVAPWRDRSCRKRHPLHGGSFCKAARWLAPPRSWLRPMRSAPSKQPHRRPRAHQPRLS